MNLQKHFADVADFRVPGRCLHELSDILLIVLLGTLADCHDFPEIEDYAKDKKIFGSLSNPVEWVTCRL